MKIKHFYLIALMAFVLQLPVFSAFAQTEPVVAYADIEARGAQIKGSSTFAQAKDQIEITGFSYTVKSPRDVANGAAMGKNTVTISLQKRADIASVPLHTATQNNELLNKVTISFYHRGPNGQMVKFQTIELQLAAISQFSQHLVTNSPNGSGLFEELELTATRIELAANDSTSPAATGSGTPKYDIKTNKSN